MKLLKNILLLMLLSSSTDLLLAQEIAGTANTQRITYITGKVDKKVKHDSILLVLQGPFFSYGTMHPEQFSPGTLKTIVNKDGEFKFKIITVNSPFHISLYISDKRDTTFGLLNSCGDIDKYLIEAGDSVHIAFATSSRTFTGKGAALFQTQYQVEQADKDRKELMSDPTDALHHNVKHWLARKDSLLNVKLNVLSLNKLELSSTSYNIVRGDIISDNRFAVYNLLYSCLPLFATQGKIPPDFAVVFDELKGRPDYIDHADRAALSPKYVDYLYNKLRFEAKYKLLLDSPSTHFDHNLCNDINEQFDGLLRDKLLAWWLYDVNSLNRLQPEYLANALSVMKTPNFIEMAEELKAVFAQGQPITDYDFKDAKGRTVHLADFKGKVVLVDFWFSGCGGCINVAKGLPKVEEAFKGRNDVVFVSMSIDKNKNKWLRSISSKPTGIYYTHYTTPTTVYLYTGGTAGNNPFIKKYVPLGAYPFLLLIDKGGKVFSSTPPRPVGEQNQLALIKEIKRALDTR
ncbi:TlpA family protein disulfide reductase [Flavobacterium zepuense]|uniref:TlpA family protein disulfide reductase n=1 Tax=Flavobacterium zepuense TaxID=2593302 RepID=A0A552UTC0_9FLAO|nr:TlpA disulfide reductase family protein [Flavobacterium zepuense]TRW21482.1 TlpA family protein disulfide reductase [Flavobacterium zepuense]